MSKLVNTATLVRGRVYFYKNEEYKRDVPKVVDEDTALELEALTEEVYDSDGDVMDKHVFKVAFDTTPPPLEETEDRKVRHLRLRREERQKQREAGRVIPRRRKLVRKLA
jgi:hypothetical protein